MTAMGTEYSVPSGSFREAEFRWTLFGNESEVRTGASRANTVSYAEKSAMALIEAKAVFQEAYAQKLKQWPK